MLAGTDEHRVEQGGRAGRHAVDGDLGAVHVHDHDHVAGGLAGLGNALLGAVDLVWRGCFVLAQELLQVVAALDGMIGLELGLAEVEQHRRMALERVGLEEEAARVFVVTRVVGLHAFEEALACQGCDGVGRLGVGLARTQGQPGQDQTAQQGQPGRGQTDQSALWDSHAFLILARDRGRIGAGQKRCCAMGAPAVGG